MRKPVMVIVLYLAGGAFLFQGATEVGAKKPIRMRTEILSIPASAFIPANELVEYANNGVQISVQDTYGAFYAPVLLPHGAVVNKVTLDAHDDTPTGYVAMSLVAHKFRDVAWYGIYSRLALCRFADYQIEAPGDLTLSVDCDDQIDNAVYSYGLTVQIDNGGDGEAAARFFRAVIEYSVEE